MQFWTMQDSFTTSTMVCGEIPIRIQGTQIWGSARSGPTAFWPQFLVCVTLQFFFTIHFLFLHSGQRLLRYKFAVR